MKRTFSAALLASVVATPLAAEIRIGHIYGQTGALEAYAAQTHTGLMLGLEYATGGTMEVNGEPISVLEYDTQLDPARARALLAEAYGDDEVHIAVGPVSSGVALAMLPVAEEYEQILIVEPPHGYSDAGNDVVEQPEPGEERQEVTIIRIFNSKDRECQDRIQNNRDNECK